MKITAITKKNCPKCIWEKNLLKEFNIKWLDFNVDVKAKTLVTLHGIDKVPVFIMDIGCGEPIITQSVLYVRDFYLGEV